jgi:carbamoyltransferase
MNILGINAFHGDSSASLIINGELIASAEEERFRRIKHWAGLPAESIRYCLYEAEVSLNEVDVIAINQDSKAALWKKIGYTLVKKPDLKFVFNKIKTRRKRESLTEQFEKIFPDNKFTGNIIPVEHHLSHLSSAFHVSPFNEAVVVSVDGFGDFASGAWGIGRGTNINIEHRVHFPHSLGIFYQALTQYLGFPNYGDEYKVMGLAPYGKPAFMEEMRQIVTLHNDGSYKLNLNYFNHHRENVAYEWENGSPVFGPIFSDSLIDLLGVARGNNEELTQKHFDIAHSIQAMYEEAFFHLLNTLYKKYEIDNLALSGGCAMNSVANGKVYRKTPFKRVYIQSAAGDAGGAIGAAFVTWHKLNPRAGRVFQMDHAYWGPEYNDSEINEVLENKSEALHQQACSVREIDDEAELCKQTAEAIADGKVSGWFQGRMEWGPRALGNRSILCDPRRSDMKEVLNLKIKRRESFRPFAPSILREHVLEWFEEDDDVPFMMKVFQIREEKRTEIPAVTHVDGSGRLQTVNEETNSRYYHLIQAFKNITGIPILLNTSFNENEPVVCKPEEALDCFLRTKMDVLVMGKYFIQRNIE